MNLLHQVKKSSSPLMKCWTGSSREEVEEHFSGKNYGTLKKELG